MQQKAALNTTDERVSQLVIRTATDPIAKFFTEQSDKPLVVTAQSVYAGPTFINDNKLKKLLKKSDMKKYVGIHKMACEVSRCDLNGCDIKFSIANPKKFRTKRNDDCYVNELYSNIVIGNISKQSASIIDIDITQDLSSDNLDIDLSYSNYPDGKHNEDQYHHIARATYSIADELMTNSEPFFVEAHLGDSMIGVNADMFEIVDMSDLFKYKNKVRSGEVGGFTFLTELKN